MRLLHSLGVFALAFSTHAAAMHCPSPDNLVANCGFDAGIAGYEAQTGDGIEHEPLLGSTADGALRVFDTEEDGNTEAEAELCIDLSAQTNYRVGADFLAEAADQCFMGWDEYVQPGCVQTNGIFRPATPVAVNDNGFTTFEAVLATSPDVQSVELVMVCNAGGGTPTRFVVDDVFVLRGPMFFDGFED